MKTLEQRIDGLRTKAGNVAVKFNDVMYLIENPTQIIRPCTWIRSKGHMRLRDVSGNCIDGLNLLCVDYETGNDAPRCGKEGYFIRLTAKGRKQVSAYNRKRLAFILEAKAASAKAAEERKARITAEIAAMPENSQFEARWNSGEMKAASGLSWNAYRESLKAEFKAEWQLLKAKFKAQQS